MILDMTLDNGLQAIVKENHRVPLVIVQVFVKTGSIHEGKYLGTGISHILEHIVYRGPTIHRTEEVVNDTLEFIGNSANAYTAKDHTSYYIIASKIHFDVALELMADCVMNSSINEHRFQRELGVIQREIEERENDLEKIFWQFSVENMFRVHPIRFPVIGFRENLAHCTLTNVIEWQKMNYIPNNMIFVVVGDVNAEQTLRKIKATFEHFKRGREYLALIPQEPPQVTKRILIKEINTNVARMNIGFKTVSFLDPHRYPLDVISSVLSAGSDSRLSKLNRTGKEVVTSVSLSSFTPSFDEGYFAITSLLKPSMLDEAEGKILKLLYDLKSNPIKIHELNRAKKQKISQHLIKNQTIRNEALELGINALTTFNPCFNKDYIERIEKVTPFQIQETAEKFFRDDHLTITILKPSASETPRAKKKVHQEEPQIEKITLPNGMTLLLKEDHRTPLVSAQNYFRGGVRLETEKNSGISNLLAMMMLKGSQSYPPKKIAEVIESGGGRISASSGKNTFSIKCELLNSEIKRNLEILSDAIKFPLLSAKELEVQKKLVMNTIKQEDERWELEVSNFFRQIFFKKSPYRLNPLGSEESVAALTHKDLIEFYHQYVIPSNLVMAIFGDIDSDRTKTTVFEMFKDFVSNHSFEHPSIPQEDPILEDEKKIRTHEKNIVSICIGFPGIAIRNCRDRFPLQVLEGVLSGVNYPGGRLHKELREKKLVYSVKSVNFMGVEPGSFEILSATRPEMMEEVIGIILENVRKLRTGLVEEEELKKGKINAIMAYLLELQKISSMAADAALYEIYGLDYNFPQTYPHSIEEVTANEVQRIADTYFCHYRIAIVTPC